MTSQQLKPSVLIKTFGCQMNFYDTEVALGELKHAGYDVYHDFDSADPALTDPRESKKQEWYDAPADVVIMNTCSVREHAEDRVFSRLGMLRVAKERNPNLVIGLMGCMVEEHREKLFKRFPQIDLMTGTRNIKDLPGLIARVKTEREQVASIRQNGLSIEYTDQIQRGSTYHAWLPIMTGCNKVCTFCIVPKTRGVEVSMKARDVYREASRLVSQGVVWITLLGQNVNSYRGEEEGGTHVSFSKLLQMLCEIKGLERISFTTSHPQDATEELFQTIRSYPKISRRFHLPLQSGSNAMLKRMKRLHTVEEFYAKVDRLRELVPDISLTTDIIVGFSGETEDDHRATESAMKRIRFDNAYVYKYSLRPGTPAAKLPDDVPMKVKDARNHELLHLQRTIQTENNKAWIGRTVEGFFETLATKNKDCLLARTAQDKKVSVLAPKSMLGSFGKIRLTAIHHETFSGELDS